MPVIQSSTGCLARQLVDVGGLPGVDGAARVGEQLGVLGRRIDHLAHPERDVAATHPPTARVRPARAPRRATARRSFPAPGRRSTHRRATARPADQQLPVRRAPTATPRCSPRRRCPAPASTPRCRRRGRPGRARAAASTISGELSTASTTASGQRSESVHGQVARTAAQVDDAARDSAPHPRQQVEERPPRWSAKARYTSGFHMSPVWHSSS